MDYPVYCEQAQINNFFEPWNTITNLAFIFSGILLFIQFRKRNQLDFKGIYFSSLLIIIGIGSFIWHLYRNNLTLTADSIPIALFVLSYLFFYLKFITKKPRHLILLFLGFFIYTPILTMLLNSKSIYILENGGAGYFSAISYFFVLQIYNIFHRKAIIKSSIIIGIVFLISLGFRQIDMTVCEHISFGTHFIWHILNALSLYFFVKLLYPKNSL